MDIIRTTLVKVEQRLNEFFRNQTMHLSDDKHEWVVLSNIVDHEGASYEGAKNKVVMFLANIAHETSISTFNRTRPIKNKGRPADAPPVYAADTPPLYINLYVLFLANFFNAKYKDGLSAISTVISFFQQYPVLNHQNFPELDARIDKLTFEMTNLDPTELSYLMGMAGTKYLPSVYYKVRMIPFQVDAMKATVPALKGLKTPADLEDQPIPLASLSEQAATFPDNPTNAASGQMEERR